MTHSTLVAMGLFSAMLVTYLGKLMAGSVKSLAVLTCILKSTVKMI